MSQFTLKSSASLWQRTSRLVPGTYLPIGGSSLCVLNRTELPSDACYCYLRGFFMPQSKNKRELQMPPAQKASDRKYTGLISVEGIEAELQSLSTESDSLNEDSRKA